jgi:hypothetical protein
MPFILTTEAIEKLKIELESMRRKPGSAFRLHTSPSGGFGLRLDEPGPDDVVLRHEGEPLLVVKADLADRLSDAALDIGKNEEEPDWVLVRGRVC